MPSVPSERSELALASLDARPGQRVAGRAMLTGALFTGALLAGAVLLVPAGEAIAENVGLRLSLLEPSRSILRLDSGAPFGIIFLGITVFAATIALMHLRARKLWQRRDANQREEIGNLQAAKDRAELFLSAEPQILITWNNGEPDIIGDLSIVLDAPIPRRVLGFGGWLPGDQAKMLEYAVDKLRDRGEHFKMALRATTGKHIEAEGHAITGRVVLRLRDVTGDRLALLRLKESHTRILDEAMALKTLLNTAPQAAWLRDAQGNLTWVNAAYADAVEAGDADEAVSRKIELLERDARLEASRLRHEGKTFKARVQTVIAGKRRKLDVVETPTPGGSAGIVADMTEVEAIRADMEMQREAHTRMLNHLPIGIASFDRMKRLHFFNQAYVSLWSLDPEFLKAQPTDGEILDRLRAAGELPEQADFRSWKAQLLEGYRSLDTREFWWSLPDGRHVRVVANPNSLGGVTYLFDDLTERYSLETQVHSLTKVQDETLDSLREGVAVFGSDGRLKLGNPAFAEMWKIDRSKFAAEPHVDQVIEASARPGAREAWQHLRPAITGFNDTRMSTNRRLRMNGIKIDATTIPLSDGATLINFVDVTANVRVEQALRERNEALENASRFKTSFIKNVSFELRSPLTSVIGFGQALAAGTAGPLTERQQGYAHYITQSSEALLNLIDDILDIASIDAGTIDLELAPVDIPSLVEQAALDLKSRLTENKMPLAINTDPSLGVFMGDARRIRQVLYNLLSNAIDFSNAGQAILISATRGGDRVTLSVKDSGQQLPAGLESAEIGDAPRQPDEGAQDTLNRGAGLRLSIVRSLVELHGGDVRIISSARHGTEVICTFPVNGQSARIAAE
ncbi:MAG: PAS-domain containing protein [Beijerinckiaceae bacterium]|nr:PAS-domain containing protein [Beijerinckiaceae bacterium]